VTKFFKPAEYGMYLSIAQAEQRPVGLNIQSPRYELFQMAQRQVYTLGIKLTPDCGTTTRLMEYSLQRNSAPGPFERLPQPVRDQVEQSKNRMSFGGPGGAPPITL
jgi:hypothetical protein